ncbi:MAG: AAA family ATPase, partial [Caldimicrobium sp.]
MKPFMTIAIPHKDVLEGRLTMDVLAADLWKVVKGEGPDEYKDPYSFFKRTYITKGLENILKVAQNRLKGEGGDPVIQLQTPFGGGKTHTLIALYHRAKEWGAKVVAIDGTVLDPKETTLWEEFERQITGEASLLKGMTSPGREKIERLISKNQPLLILMDELLEYAAKAAGIKVGDSNLAAQTLAFMQELTVAISS